MFCLTEARTGKQSPLVPTARTSPAPCRGSALNQQTRTTTANSQAAVPNFSFTMISLVSFGLPECSRA